MKKKLFFGCTAMLVLLVATAGAQDPGIQAIIGNVFLQNTTPGTVQAGHASISGTFRAGQVFVQQAGGSTIPVVGNNLSTTGDTIGGSFSVASPSGTALRGTATSGIGTGTGVLGVSRAPDGTGVFGQSTATTGTGIGVVGSTAASKGYGVVGKMSSFTDGAAIYGVSTASGNVGVLGESNFGIAVSAETTSGTGLFARTKNNNGRAITAVSDVPGSNCLAGNFFGTSQTIVSVQNTKSTGGTFGLSSETTSSGGVAILGNAVDSGAGIGVHGRGLGATGFGVFSSGRFGATGTKNFVIDHPLDPENRYLMHYSAEGPEPMNVYSGKVQTDAKGFATVRLPDYYESINRDPRIQLTVYDSSTEIVIAKVARDVENGSFRIWTNKANVKVSWRLEAVRNDRWVKTYGAAVEPQKPAEYKGTYLQPELYGKPQTYGQHQNANRGPRSKP